MQHSLYEIKEKLLQALDHEYNVVDMDAVLDVITALEKAIITKDALEKTRIGKYINELRKRTTNEQLARRAKDLVKSWRRLLPPTVQRVNGEESHHNLISSPGSITVLGPGPGPGVGPGPGPGNRSLKAYVSVPGTPRYKTSSPSVMVEQSSSPYFSSASNSPLLNCINQGSSLSSLPTNYAPVKMACHQTNKAGDNSVNKTLNNNYADTFFSQYNKPVSPSFLKHSIVTSSGTCTLPSQTCPSPNWGIKSNSSSNSPSLNASSSYTQNTSPTIAFSGTHSSLELAKTNVANKRLQKESVLCNSDSSPELILSDTQTKIGNGMNTPENESPCDSSAFGSTLCNSILIEGETTASITSTKNPKRKRSLENLELHESPFGDMIVSLNSNCKLPKVKTTQQIIADLQAKKGFNSVLSPNNLSSVDALHSTESEVSRTKSELLKKFLIASQCTRNEDNRESPIDESGGSSISDYPLQSVPGVSSVISTNLNASSNNSHLESIDEEIKRILSALPPLNPAEIILDETIAEKQHRSLENDLNRLNDQWEYVNGVYDCNGFWKPWQQCTEQKSYLEESFQILPYVNIN